MLIGRAASAQPPSDLVFPDPTHKIVIVAADSCAGDFPCGHILPEDDPLRQAAMQELSYPFHRSLIKVVQCLRNSVGDAAGPNVLYLSAEEGGYARTGLTIVGPDGKREYPNLRYVDLVLDSGRVANGELDIFSHELGHVMMGIVWPDRWEGWSPKQHVSMGITDDYMALSEGWGIHFQQLALDNVEKYRTVERRTWHYTQESRQLWHSQLDTRLRLEGVRHNDYIHRKLLPGADTAGMSLIDLIFLEHTSPNFDRCRLKNAQEMLASEGAIATIFYRMTTDSILQNNYQGWDFYQPYLLRSAPANQNPRDVFTPLENVLIKYARVWKDVRPHVDSSSAPLIAIIKTWGEIFPEDRKELVTLFLATTVATTVTDELNPLYEQVAYAGTVGKYLVWRASRAEYDSAFAKVCDDVLEGRRALDANVGPQLWVENPNFQIPITVFFAEPTAPLRVNLNTAGLFDLMSFSSLTIDKARQIIHARDSLGYFDSMEQARSVGWR